MSKRTHTYMYRGVRVEVHFTKPYWPGAFQAAENTDAAAVHWDVFVDGMRLRYASVGGVRTLARVVAGADAVRRDLQQPISVLDPMAVGWSVAANSWTINGLHEDQGRLYYVGAEHAQDEASVPFSLILPYVDHMLERRKRAQLEERVQDLDAAMAKGGGEKCPS